MRNQQKNMAASAWLVIPDLSPGNVFRLLSMASATYVTASTFLSTAMQSIMNFLESRMNAKYQTTVLFFPDQTFSCRCRISARHRKSNCNCRKIKSTMETLITNLKGAKRSLDICMFTISSPQLANVALQLHAKGVVVRVITDCDKMDLVISQTMNFRAAGIQVRHDKSSFLMHNKFIVIDKETLINGSFNWTNQAVYGNRENVLITNFPPIVTPYVREFEKLWKEYNPLIQKSNT